MTPTTPASAGRAPDPLPPAPPAPPDRRWLWKLAYYAFWVVNILGTLLLVNGGVLLWWSSGASWPEFILRRDGTWLWAILGFSVDALVAIVVFGVGAMFAWEAWTNVWFFLRDKAKDPK